MNERYRIGVLPFEGDTKGEARETIARELSGVSDELDVRKLDARAPTVDTEALSSGEVNDWIESITAAHNVEVVVWGTALDGGTVTRVFLAAWPGAFDVDHFTIPALLWIGQRDLLRLGPAIAPPSPSGRETVRLTTGRPPSTTSAMPSRSSAGESSPMLVSRKPQRPIARRWLNGPSNARRVIACWRNGRSTT
jgi:hypothetical protein